MNGTIYTKKKNLESYESFQSIKKIKKRRLESTICKGGFWGGNCH